MNKHYSACLLTFFFFTMLKTYDGQLDPTFGQNGIVETSFSGVQNAAVYAVSAATGLIFTAGYAQGPIIGSQFAIAAYLNNGTINPNFGTSGMGLPTNHGQK